MDKFSYEYKGYEIPTKDVGIGRTRNGKVCIFYRGKRFYKSTAYQTYKTCTKNIFYCSKCNVGIQRISYMDGRELRYATNGKHHTCQSRLPSIQSLNIL